MSLAHLLTFTLGSTFSLAQDLYPEYDIDPYLLYRPAFARSLPIQILLTGVVLTLVAVLLIYLVLTAQYHWPLAPVNYALQLSAVVTLLISLIATLHVVLSATLSESQKWPYMLSYIAVNVPPLDLDPDVQGWTVAERAIWLLMNATTSGLIQITHIQFLTLLYPSRLEARLIITLLGPLAIIAAVMQLLPISGSSEVDTIASAVRNVCNATLSLLFTIALFLWGFLVNKKQAWRTDGGTAVFGCAALTLAVVSTALNVLYVPREEEYVWLPSLIWAVILWQSFLGWWWWVGAGSGSGLGGENDIMHKIKREADRGLKRREIRERKRETKQRAKKALKGVAVAFADREHGHQDPSPHPSSHLDAEPTYLAPSHPHQESLHAAQPSSASISAPSTFALSRFLPTTLRRWFTSLRHAHLVAAREQAVKRVERIRELCGNKTYDVGRTGWGLGSFGWKIGRESLHDQTKWSTHQEYIRSRQDLERRSSRGSDDVDDIEHPARPAPAVTATENGFRSLWWWGPLAQWRLRDSTVY